MSDVIRRLPDSVANQIAAGEVIQRPAAVIKELVENAVDAGATEIRVIVRDAGKTLIQIIDNGCGMSDTDVRMAIERHATSKIKTADDLFGLNTMGFRGEALPSVCAVSEVEIKTRTDGSQIGTRLCVSASKVTAQEPCVCERGTVISVHRIFFNVPARRKFLKSDSVELANIMREFERLALVNNNIRMMIDTGVRQLDLRPASLRLRIEDIWKNTLKSDHLIPVDVDTSLVKIEGFVSRPEYARRRNPLQYLIVNGRNMRHPYFHKAIESCYDSLIAPDTRPCYFMRFTVDPSTIDVNIHPTKNEIKFEYEQQIWPILVSAVKTALGKYSAVPSIDFSVDAIALDPLREGESPEAPEISDSAGYNPFRSSTLQARRNSMPRVGADWEKLYENFTNPDDSPLPGEWKIESHTPAEEKLFDVAPAVCLQIGLKYIVLPFEDGLALIDQHRAHLKILYEEYLERASRQEVVSQQLMFPESLRLDESQQQALAETEDELHKLGFDLKQRDAGEWLLTAVPALPAGTDARDIILRVLDSVTEDSVNYGREGSAGGSIRSRLSLTMARAAAVRRGQRLSQTEMEKITGALFALPSPSLTPDGNPVFVVLNDQRLSNILR